MPLPLHTTVKHPAIPTIVLYTNVTLNPTALGGSIRAQKGNPEIDFGSVETFQKQVLLTPFFYATNIVIDALDTVVVSPLFNAAEKA